MAKENAAAMILKRLGKGDEEAKPGEPDSEEMKLPILKKKKKP